MSKKRIPWTPITKATKPKSDPAKYSVRLVLEYLNRAYGDECRHLTHVPKGYSCAQEAIEVMGYEYEEGDGYFPKDPRIPKPLFKKGTLVVTKCGGVGKVRKNSSSSYAIKNVKGYKHPPYIAWYDESELRALPEGEEP
jgi:hypothetical protein